MTSSGNAVSKIWPALASWCVLIPMVFAMDQSVAFCQAPEETTAAIDTLVICPPEFQEALQPWLAYRQQQGHRIAVSAQPATAFEVRQLIRERFEQSPATPKRGGDQRVRHVVLIGDSRGPDASLTVPTDYIRSQINVRYGGSEAIATDSRLADTDGDRIPDLSIGRIPADSVEELKTILAKTIAYEQELDHGRWRRKVNMVAGLGGFGVVEDRVIETTTKKLLTELIPHSYDVSVTFASWSSPFCPDPRRFHETVVERMNEGSLFWVYIGHGHYQQLDRVRLGARQYPILDVAQVEKLNCRSGMPIAIFLACSTCGFDYEADCMGEAIIKQERGPVAVIGGSRVTMPYGMAVMSLELMKDFFSEQQSETLGELMLAAKQRMVADSDSSEGFREIIDVLGKAFSPHADELQQERLEHVHLMQLLGDPLLRLPRPEQAAVEAPGQAMAGQLLEFSVNTPMAGEALLELSYRRDRLTFRPKRRTSSVMSDSELGQLQQDYDRANNRVKSILQTRLVAGTNRLQLEIPDDARGECNIRVFVAGSEAYAQGSRPILIKQSE